MIDCVVLNTCNGGYVARELFEKHSVQMVIYWDTQVDDEAAKCFSEGEYLILDQVVALGRVNFLK